MLAYRPRTVVVPDVVHRDDVGALAWAGMHGEGSVVRLWGDAGVRVDALLEPVNRVAAIARLVPPRGVVGRLAAAWVHAGGPAPARVAVLVPSGGRRTDPHPDRIAAEADLLPEDVVRIGAARATSLLRTGLDVATCCPPEAAWPALVRLVVAGLDPDAALRRLDGAPGRRGSQAARGLLASL